VKNVSQKIRKRDSATVKVIANAENRPVGKQKQSTEKIPLFPYQSKQQGRNTYSLKVLATSLRAKSPC
jgi:hypothetical protein